MSDHLDCPAATESLAPDQFSQALQSDNIQFITGEQNKLHIHSISRNPAQEGGWARRTKNPTNITISGDLTMISIYQIQMRQQDQRVTRCN